MTGRRNGIALKCPRCGREGIARFSRAEALAYLEGDAEASIDHVPHGFLIVLRESWQVEVDVICAAHDVSALVMPPLAVDEEAPLRDRLLRSWSGAAPTRTRLPFYLID
ncbi:hypothetical protein GCM10010994_16770 [Chelatococcus reniformis]|uniref:Uncharacterized protein n=2 Tax=Chelatococcus reniformis TaxID=1494448 RepID=A0A916XA04_9HYPH|nr:hypothetical protein GCM10010994_16770 [Chelatococcus reniformis]